MLPPRMPLALKARLDRRPYWEVEYNNGRRVRETDGIDWSALPRKGLLRLTLYLPDGKAVALGNTQNASEKLFQFKVAVATVGKPSRTRAYVVGIVTGLNGECTLYAWKNDRLVGPVQDNVHAMHFENIGPMSLEVLGIGRV